jgi:hypothetical protein
MKKIPLLKSILMVATGSLLVSGCVTRERVVYQQSPPPPQSQPPPMAGEEIVVTEAPPPVIVEAQTTRPGRNYVWIEGAYIWHGRWVWEHGHWARPPHRGAVWVPHRYENRGGVHVFISGYWR